MAGANVPAWRSLAEGRRARTPTAGSLAPVVLPQPGGVVGSVKSADGCEPLGDAACNDQLVAGDGPLMVGALPETLDQFGSADSVFNNGGVSRYLLGFFRGPCDPEKGLTLLTKETVSLE